MNAPLAARLELEMLHRIGDVDLRAINFGLDEDFVEQPAGGTHERLAGGVFLVSRLLADEDHGRAGWSFSENSLGGVLVEVAAAAAFRLLAHLGERSGRPVRQILVG